MKFLFLLSPLLFLAACGAGSDPDGKVKLARAFDAYLYMEDVKELFPHNITAADSERVMKAYIDNWLRHQVLANKADKNLTEAEKNVDAQISEYRNSLLIHKYQMKLVSERLDTAVTEDQLKEYYDRNRNNFELKRNMVQLTFVKVEEASPQADLIRKLFRSSRLEDKATLSELCTKYANNFFLDDEVWLDFDEILKELPIRSYDQEHFLRNNKFLEVKEGNYLYLINIRAYRIRNSTAALEFEKENIRNILLNERKLELLKQMELKVLGEAGVNRDIEKYR
jgi:hypothetical protein